MTRSGRPANFFQFLQSLGDCGSPAEFGAIRSSRRRRQFESAEVQLITLELIASKPRHGYEIIREIEALSGDVYSPSPGLIYPILTLLNDMGWIEESDPTASRKSFRITRSGKKETSRRADEIDALLKRLKALGAPKQDPTIGRAMQNLMTAVAALAAEDLPPDRIDAIADILDATTRNIERSRRRAS